jgi:hypothetical protein
MRLVRAAVAALFLLVCAVGVAEDSHSFTVMSKNWVEIPQEFRHQAPNWKSYAGTWQSAARNKQNNVYIHTIGRMGWEYSIKDRYGRFYTLYAGRDWTWSPGDKVILTGAANLAGVFIPRGAKNYGR